MRTSAVTLPLLLSLALPSLACGGAPAAATATAPPRAAPTAATAATAQAVEATPITFAGEEALLRQLAALIDGRKWSYSTVRNEGELTALTLDFTFDDDDVPDVRTTVEVFSSTPEKMVVFVSCYSRMMPSEAGLPATLAIINAINRDLGLSWAFVDDDREVATRMGFLVSKHAPTPAVLVLDAISRVSDVWHDEVWPKLLACTACALDKRPASP
ncbi:MAG: hypothetical protein KBG28_04870 [Kofleriaceae bacterium]|nr:hypothetical protein [Kofleriaceae bacterium]MBP6836699.1 hypothetical protein [Kofleriaceae bacterium]MBP9203275.1 hypothetical protein [Kofleriaceae bacterium]